MPVYEYEHVFDECEMCGQRFAVVQSLDEPNLEYCPCCGLEVKRVVSQVSSLKGRPFKASEAAKKGFTTWKKSGEGEWEKIDGPGVDAIVGSEADKAALEAESVPILDLDRSE